MQVYVQKSTRTTFPRRPSGVSGSELSQPVAPSKPGRWVSAPSLANQLISQYRRPRAARLLSVKRLERGSHLGREELRLLPGREVAALVGVVEVGEVGVPRLDPAPRGHEDLVGEGRVANRDRDWRRSLTGRENLGS